MIHFTLYMLIIKVRLSSSFSSTEILLKHVKEATFKPNGWGFQIQSNINEVLLLPVLFLLFVLKMRSLHFIFANWCAFVLKR